MGCINNKDIAKTKSLNESQDSTKKNKFKGVILKEIETTTSMEDIKKVYKIKSKIIGHGHFGIVRIGSLHQNPEKQFAIKTIEKSKLKKDLHILSRELRILMSLDHPNIIKFYETYQDDKYFHLVMEYCSGGELIERITGSGHLSENEAGKLMFKILLALNYLHERSICHRDIKPENFLLSDKTDQAEVKIIDFGLSKHIDEEEDNMSQVSTNKLMTVVGTPLYVAPEVLKGKYDFKCDIWSLGIVLYILLCGYPPFYATSKKEIFTKIMIGKYSLAGKEWIPISKECKKFISKTINVDVNKRYSAHEALKDAWLKNVHKEQKKTLQKIDSQIINRLQAFHTSSKFKKEVLKVLVNMLSEKDIKELREAFLTIDTNNKGTITLEELKIVMKDLGHKHTEDEIRKIMTTLNVENDENGINYTEFLTATLDKKNYMTKEKLFQAFKYFDVDNTNYITANNLSEAMSRVGKKIETKELESWIKDNDLENNNKISFEEFRIMMDRDDISEINGSMKMTLTQEENSSGLKKK